MDMSRGKTREMNNETQERKIISGEFGGYAEAEKEKLTPCVQPFPRRTGMVPAFVRQT